MFFVIPILICFILLCILVNVDFTGEAYNNLKIYNQAEESTEIIHDFLEVTVEVEQEKSQTMEWKANKFAKSAIGTTFNDYMLTNFEESDKTEQNFEKNEAFLELQRNILRDQPINSEFNESLELLETKAFQTKESSSEQPPTKVIQTNILPSIEFFNNRLAGQPKCLATTTNCSLYCSDGNANYIDEKLEDLIYYCQNRDLSLLVQNCEFYNGILTTGFFSSYYTLIYLAISDSNLQTIQSKAFQATALKNLQTLILRNNIITTLTATTFEGASSLKYFEFVQQPLKNAFKAEQFLQPMASNLNEAFISQAMEVGVVLNPRTWLQGSELSSLIVLNMANNNFQDILEVSTFRTLIAIENLNLSNCSLLTIPEKTFDIILSTLKYLDLSGNYLQTLDLQLLTIVVSLRIQLNLSSNKWYCDCDKPDMIEFLRDNTQLIETVVCYEPEKWQNIELKEVINDCEATITTPINTTEDSTTLSSTDSSDDSTISTLTTQPTTITSTTEIDDDDDHNTATGSPTEQSTTTSKTTEISIINTTTTEISQSSTIPTNSISVVCYDVNKTESFYWFQRNAFFIRTSSSSSVTIQILEIFDTTSIHIIYFTNSIDYKNLTTNISVYTNNLVSITGLTYNITYVFCLASTNHYIISPFDCRAHYVAFSIESWLLTTDQIWFISVIVISSLLFIAASILIVYWTLRKHPIWLLNRNERILRVNNSKQKVILISRQKSSRKVIESSSSYLTAQPFVKNENADDDDIFLYSTQHSVPSNRPPRIPTQNDNRKSSCPSYGTAQNCSLASKYLSVHFNRFHNTDTDASSLYTSQHTVPADRAPYVPKQKVGNRISTTPLYADFQQTTLASEVNFNRFQPLDDDPDYQTIDHYEVVNF